MRRFASFYILPDVLLLTFTTADLTRARTPATKALRRRIKTAYATGVADAFLGDLPPTIHIALQEVLQEWQRLEHLSAESPTVPL